MKDFIFNQPRSYSLEDVDTEQPNAVQTSDQPGEKPSDVEPDKNDKQELVVETESRETKPCTSVEANEKDQQKKSVTEPIQKKFCDWWKDVVEVSDEN